MRGQCWGCGCCPGWPGWPGYPPWPPGGAICCGRGGWGAYIGWLTIVGAIPGCCPGWAWKTFSRNQISFLLTNLIADNVTWTRLHLNLVWTGLIWMTTVVNNLTRTLTCWRLWCLKQISKPSQDLAISYHWLWIISKLWIISSSLLYSNMLNRRYNHIGLINHWLLWIHLTRMKHIWLSHSDLLSTWHQSWLSHRLVVGRTGLPRRMPSFSLFKGVT